MISHGKSFTFLLAASWIVLYHLKYGALWYFHIIGSDKPMIGHWIVILPWDFGDNALKAMILRWNHEQVMNWKVCQLQIHLDWQCRIEIALRCSERVLWLTICLLHYSESFDISTYAVYVILYDIPGICVNIIYNMSFWYHVILQHSVLFNPSLFYSILFLSFLFYSILYLNCILILIPIQIQVLFYSIAFRSILFCSIWVYNIKLHQTGHIIYICFW